MRILPLLAALALAVACGSPVDSTPAPEPGDPAQLACGAGGYVLEGAMPGDRFEACGPEKIQTTVTTGGTIYATWARPCLTIEVTSVEPGATALVIDLRGAGGRSICADTFERVSAVRE